MLYSVYAALLVTAALACAAQTADPVKINLDILSPEIIQQRLSAVPRKVADRKTTLESLFHEAGCDGDNFREERVPGSKAPNVICALPGESGDEIVVGGHLDSIEVGMGAVDDWSGAVLLPSLYQSLKGKTRRHRFVFVGFAAEEDGLVGSREFVHKLSKDEWRRIHAMINLECLGLGEPEVWVNHADKRLLDAFAVVTNTIHVHARGMNVDQVGLDDAALHILHTKADQVSAIHPDDYYTSYRLAAAYLAYLDTAIE